ncbi:MAG: septal ring lytic transglycosylase RlpA family protein [Bacteroidota bacterium]
MATVYLSYIAVMGKHIPYGKLLIAIIVMTCAFRLQAQESLVDSTWKPMYRDTGYASYYAQKFEGRRTANGERYRGKYFTAAHKKLPFGTLLKVTNPKNHKWVIVRVNDRGPHHRKRIIDLSYKAAKHLGMVKKKGIIKVYIEEIPKISPRPKD